ncbi:MAG TPA: PilZ domain-containing protein, partial [Nitrospiria bacterium]|nr:PilZ domain-containing protein [Nitrospiria bacterium]
MDSDRQRPEKEIGGEGDDATALPEKGRQAAWKVLRRFPRFNVIASAKASLPGNDLTLHILSVKDVGRGGVGLFSREDVPVGSDINVSLYSKNADRVVSAESMRGGIVSVVDWKESVYLLNIR